MVRIQDIPRHTVVCNLCLRNKTEHLFTVNSFDVVRCLNCKLVFVNPMPFPQDVADIYNSPEYYTKEGEQREIYLGYPDYMMLEQHLTFVADELLRPIKHIEKSKLLDIGCGMGIMLNRFRELGWDTYGIDISSYATEHARDKFGLKVFTGVANDLDLPQNSFDLITMICTIEHLINPRDTLKVINRLMKSGAVVIIATHDIDGIKPKIVKSKWRHLIIPEHLFFFSKNTLGRMLKETGFNIFKVTETATIASATSDETVLRTSVKFLHRHRLIRIVAPVIRGLHTINRTLNLADDITVYARKM